MSKEGSGMQETEKRAGLTLEAARCLKSTIDDRYSRKSVVNRTVVVKVDNDDFSPNPDVLIDIKAKLIGEQTLLSVKYGSWHGDTARSEHEVRFRREDLGAMLSILKLLGHAKFLVLRTVRTTWVSLGVVITLDEYGEIGQALFEVELEDNASSDEQLIDNVFRSLSIAPMNSGQTVEFVGALNQAKEIQVDLDRIQPDELAREILTGHGTC
jgi:adenylate cyclase class IV